MSLPLPLGPTLGTVARALFFAIVAAAISTANAREPAQRQIEGARFVGSVGCKSSSCHGGAGEKRDQYLIWARQDFHTRAPAVLTTSRSARIAQALGVENPTASTRCTSCHAPLQALAPARLSANVDPSEGVSCENCHGPAGTWLRGHTRTDWTYATRVGAGMRDLKSFYVRANTCVACHQNLDADLTAAGHPDLIFEMDRQSAAEPKHWRDPDGSGVRAWLVGQAVALRETSWKLAHNPIGNEQTLAQWQGLAWLLAKVTAVDGSLARIEPPGTGDASAFASSQQQADALARRVAKQNLDPGFVRRLRVALIGAEGDFTKIADKSPAILFQRAQRLTLALDALDTDDKAFKEHTDALRNDVRSLAEFDPAQFVAHLTKLRKALSPAGP